MEQQTIHQTALLERIKAGQSIKGLKLTFDDTKVEALDALLLGENGFIVPQELIWYNEEAINYDDDLELTDAEIASGGLKRVLSAKVPVDKEISDWLQTEQINVNDLFANLISSFYQNLKSIPKG